MDEYSGFSKLGKFVCIAMAVDFSTFVLSNLVLGGGAYNGRIVAGHYFLSNHGKLVETTEAIYTYSAMHGWSLFLLFPFVMCFSIAAGFKRHNRTGSERNKFKR
jgi:hypothetical protein